MPGNASRTQYQVSADWTCDRGLGSQFPDSRAGCNSLRGDFPDDTWIGHALGPELSGTTGPRPDRGTAAAAPEPMRHFFQTHHPEDWRVRSPALSPGTGSPRLGARSPAGRGSSPLSRCTPVDSSAWLAPGGRWTCSSTAAPSRCRPPTGRSVEVLLRRIDWSAANGQTSRGRPAVCEHWSNCIPTMPDGPGGPRAAYRRAHGSRGRGRGGGRAAPLRAARPPQPAVARAPARRRRLAAGNGRLARCRAELHGPHRGRDPRRHLGRRRGRLPASALGRSLKRWRAHQRAERGRMETERLARFNQALAFERAGELEAAERAYGRFAARFPEDSLVCEARLRGAALALRRRDAEMRWPVSGQWSRIARRLPRCVARASIGPGGARKRCSCRMPLPRRPTRAPSPSARPPIRSGSRSLTAAAPLLETRAPERAMEIYRELVTAVARTPPCGRRRWRACTPWSRRLALTTAVR